MTDPIEWVTYSVTRFCSRTPGTRIKGKRRKLTGGWKSILFGFHGRTTPAPHTRWWVYRRPLSLPMESSSIIHHRGLIPTKCYDWGSNTLLQSCIEPQDLVSHADLGKLGPFSQTAFMPAEAKSAMSWRTADWGMSCSVRWCGGNHLPCSALASFSCGEENRSSATNHIGKCYCSTLKCALFGLGSRGRKVG